MNLTRWTLCRELPTLRSLVLAGSLALSATFAPASDAAPCADFTDVDDSSPFCEAVEWIKNRMITLGCTADAYCPAEPVSRLAMAAFMKRLGDALTPIRLSEEATPGVVDLDAGLLTCAAPGLVIGGYPRTAYADLTVSAIAAAPVDFAAEIVYRVGAGGSWLPLNAVPSRGSSGGGQWGSVADLGALDIEVGQTIYFAARISRGGTGGTGNLTGSSCQLRVLVYSRTGGASPF